MSLSRQLLFFPAGCVSPHTYMPKAHRNFFQRGEEPGRCQDLLTFSFQRSLTFFLIAGEHLSLFLQPGNSRGPNLCPFLHGGAVAFKFGCGHGERQVHKSGISLQALKWSSSTPEYFLLKHRTAFAARELGTISGVNFGLEGVLLGQNRAELLLTLLGRPLLPGEVHGR